MMTSNPKRDIFTTTACELHTLSNAYLTSQTQNCYAQINASLNSEMDLRPHFMDIEYGLIYYTHSWHSALILPIRA